MEQSFMLLRVFTDELAFFGDRKVFEVVAERARDSGLAGATVFKATIGFGRSTHVHRRHVFENESAVVIEMVDAEQKLRAFVASLADLPDIGLATLQAVEVLMRLPELPETGENPPLRPPQ